MIKRNKFCFFAATGMALSQVALGATDAVPKAVQPDAQQALQKGGPGQSPAQTSGPAPQATGGATPAAAPTQAPGSAAPAVGSESVPPPKVWRVALGTLLGRGTSAGLVGAPARVNLDPLGAGVQFSRLLPPKQNLGPFGSLVSIRYLGFGGVEKKADTSIQTTVLSAGWGVHGLLPLDLLRWQAHGWLGLAHVGGFQQSQATMSRTQKWGGVVGVNGEVTRPILGSLSAGVGASVYLGSLRWVSFDASLGLPF